MQPTNSPVKERKPQPRGVPGAHAGFSIKSHRRRASTTSGLSLDCSAINRDTSDRLRSNISTNSARELPVIADTEEFVIGSLLDIFALDARPDETGSDCRGLSAGPRHQS